MTDAGSDCSHVNNSGCSADAAVAAAPIGTGQHFLNRRKGEGIVEGFFFLFYETQCRLLCGPLTASRKGNLNLFASLLTSQVQLLCR